MRIWRDFALATICMTGAYAAPVTQPSTKIAHIKVDVMHKEIRVDCEAVKAEYPLEFLAVVTNSNEYEALVHTEAKPSDLHLALLMIGMKPGEPLHYVEATKIWSPPTGPAVQIWFEYDKDGKHEKVPAFAWMRDVKTKKAAEDFAWVFTGSRTFSDGSYGGNVTGFLIGVINNELSVLDVPALKSRSLETRQWERNSDAMPPTGTEVTMILSPADNNQPTTQPAAHP